MRSSSAVRRHEAPSKEITNPKLDTFARELSELCRKHGLGITGNATLFEMEAVDYQMNYIVDQNSNLVLR
jgi:hypothetical protein